MRRIFFYLCLVVAFGLCACSDEETFSVDKHDVLTFSTDLLKMDTVFSTVPSSTYGFWVYNRSKHALKIEKVALKNADKGFRVNVDGTYLNGKVTDVEVSKGDSLYVFVELTAPLSGQKEISLVEDELLFQLSNGASQSMLLQAWQWDADIKEWWNVEQDTQVDGEMPIVVMRGMQVKEGATLRLNHCQLFFHDGASCEIKGKIEAQNTVFRGDRLDRMLLQLPYDRVSGQWEGITLEKQAEGLWNKCEIRNAMNGLRCQAASVATLCDSRLHNNKGNGVESQDATLYIRQCQLTNAAGNCLYAQGGKVEMSHCTLAQFYPFDANRGEALRVEQSSLTCEHTLITGYATDELSTKGDDLTFRHCMIRAADHSHAGNYEEVVWESEANEIGGKDHFVLIDELHQHYDFTLRTESPAYALGIGCVWTKNP